MVKYKKSIKSLHTIIQYVAIKKFKKIKKLKTEAFNPLTIINEKFTDFHETSTACSSWYTEFRTY